MDTSKIVGEKIKSLRESQSISMEELAQRSGLAIEQIERIENNIDLPSLAPLIKIARVLGVRLGTFLDDQDENGPVVCRKDESQNSISFSNNAIHSRKHMEYHSLSKSKADRHMEPFIIDVAATDDSDFVLSSHEGEEFIMVMEGTMEISYGKNTYLLEEGDSIYYDSIVPHHVHAYEGQAAKILAPFNFPLSTSTSCYTNVPSANGWNIGPKQHQTKNISFTLTATCASPGASSTAGWTTWPKDLSPSAWNGEHT